MSKLHRCVCSFNSRSGSSRRSSRSGNSRGTWSQEDLESVREVYAETDSLKHKELAQWGDDHQQEPHSSPVTPGENLMCSVSA